MTAEAHRLQESRELLGWSREDAARACGARHHGWDAEFIRALETAFPSRELHAGDIAIYETALRDAEVAQKVAKQCEELRIASGVWDVPKPLGEAKPSDYVFVGLGDIDVKPKSPLLNRKDAERELRRLAALVDSRAYTAPEAMHEIHNSAAQSLNTLARFFGLIGGV